MNAAFLSLSLSPSLSLSLTTHTHTHTHTHSLSLSLSQTEDGGWGECGDPSVASAGQGGEAGAAPEDDVLGAGPPRRSPTIHPPSLIPGNTLLRGV